MDLTVQLLWKVSDGLYARRKFEQALQWCHISRSSILQLIGGANEGKILRRIALCHLELGEMYAAKTTLAIIPEQDMGTALTNYLLFLIDLHGTSDEQVLNHVHKLITSKDFRVPLLYHCAVQATNAGKTHLTQSLLSLILDQTQKSSSDAENLQLPALVRCIIRLSKNELEKNPAPEHRELELICVHFELAARLASSEEIALQNGFSNRELEWFSKNAHNLALAGLTRWPASYVLRLLSCTKLVGPPTRLMAESYLVVPSCESVRIRSR